MIIANPIYESKQVREEMQMEDDYINELLMKDEIIAESKKTIEEDKKTIEKDKKTIEEDKKIIEEQKKEIEELKRKYGIKQ